MRTVIGYTPEGAKVWSENHPAENLGWGHALGGQAIQERGPMTKQQLQIRYKAAKRLRGSALAPGEKL